MFTNLQFVFHDLDQFLGDKSQNIKHGVKT